MSLAKVLIFPETPLPTHQLHAIFCLLENLPQTSPCLSSILLKCLLILDNLLDQLYKTAGLHVPFTVYLLITFHVSSQHKIPPADKDLVFVCCYLPFHSRRLAEILSF